MINPKIMVKPINLRKSDNFSLRGFENQLRMSANNVLKKKEKNGTLGSTAGGLS